MSVTRPSDPAPTARVLRVLTWFTVGWVLLCLVVSAGAGWQIAQIRSSADALDNAGRALSSTSAALKSISKLPIVGKGAKKAATAVDKGGKQARSAAVDTRESIMRTAVVASLLLALLPTIPLLVVRWALVALFDERRRRP